MVRARMLRSSRVDIFCGGINSVAMLSVGLMIAPQVLLTFNGRLLDLNDCPGNVHPTLTSVMI